MADNVEKKMIFFVSYPGEFQKVLKILMDRQSMLKLQQKLQGPASCAMHSVIERLDNFYEYMIDSGYCMYVP